ncbi:MAG: alcohol dehydrogenase catalytic domain-containing protein [Candidatus Methylomirabilales bacterium]
MGDSMRAVMLPGPNRMELEEVPRPVPRPDQVLVRYSACCATDFDLIDGTMLDQAKYPLILGHEWSGQVVEAPPELSALVGKDIVADNLVTCGTCPACVAGRLNLCRKMDELGFSLNGSHAEYLVTLARNVRVLPSGLSPKAAALAEPVGVALYGTRRARMGLCGESGSGPGCRAGKERRRREARTVLPARKGKASRPGPRGSGPGCYGAR